MTNTQPETPENEESLDTGAPAEENPLAAELAKTKDQLLRAVAEAENIRKRAERERVDISRYSIASFAKGLLSVADNLRRALDSVPEDQREGNSVYTGVEATERELLRVFESAGIKKITPHGEVFNPNFHEVMFEIESDQPPGTVLQVMEPGYVIHDRLLRPARVGVAKNSGQEQKPVIDEKV